MDPYDRKREELTKDDFEGLQEAEIIDEKTAEAIMRYQTAVRRSLPEVRKTLGAFPDVAKGEGAVEVLRRLVVSNARVAELEAALRSVWMEVQFFDGQETPHFEASARLVRVAMRLDWDEEG